MPSISSIDQNSWDQCLAPDGSSSPFLRHSWLYSLEESGCATIDKGWMPMHVRIRVDGEVSAYIPMYVKSHSMGEFIFDGEWAKYAQENGIEYYPKLLVGKLKLASLFVWAMFGLIKFPT
jgi:predicted N-acyltransferase